MPVELLIKYDRRREPSHYNKMPTNNRVRLLNLPNIALAGQ